MKQDFKVWNLQRHLYTQLGEYITVIFVAVPLAEPQCQTERCGGHGVATEDCRIGHCGQSQETFHG